MVDVVDRKEVERGGHLRVQNIKQHRLQHQDKGDEHFVAPGLIKLEGLAEEENRHHHREDNQHQVGNFDVMHQPGADKNHDHRSGQHVQQVAQA